MEPAVVARFELEVVDLPGEAPLPVHELAVEEAQADTNRNAGQKARRQELPMVILYPEDPYWTLSQAPLKASVQRGGEGPSVASRRMSRSRVRMPSAFSTQREMPARAARSSRSASR